MSTDARVIGTDPSADLRAAARLARLAGERISTPPQFRQHRRDLAARLDALADALPLRDAVIEAACDFRDGTPYGFYDLRVAVDALRAVNTGEDQ